MKNKLSYRIHKRITTINKIYNYKKIEIETLYKKKVDKIASIEEGYKLKKLLYRRRKKLHYISPTIRSYNTIKLSPFGKRAKTRYNSFKSNWEVIYLNE